MAQQVTPWQVLKQRDFGLFWASLLFSAVGSQISTVAIAWQVYEITNSPFQLGLAGLFRALPIMLLSIPGGVLADRMDRRRLLIITQSLAALLALALALLSYFAAVQVWQIYLVTFLSGAVGIFDAPARTALIPTLVRPEQLATAYALNITWRQIATLSGPFIGGVIIADRRSERFLLYRRAELFERDRLPRADARKTGRRIRRKERIAPRKRTQWF